MITFEGVHKAFGERRVLEDISVAFEPGQVTALIGPNGSGKTTLIKILLGLARADAGVVRVNGQAVDAAGAYRSTVGYMPQTAKFPDHLRVHELFDLVTALRSGAPRDEELIESFHLAAEWDRPVGTLSGGTKQRVNAAIAFLFRPAILVCDEPTAGLDPISAGILRDRIKREREAGHTVIVTSHVLSELEELSQRVAFLCDGRLRFVGSIAELLSRTGATRVEPAIAALMRESRVRPPADERSARVVAPEFA